jgi:hypothetical protein
MSQISLLQQSHRDFFLEEGFLFALQFKEGWVVFRVKGWEDSVLKPWNLGSCSALSNLSAYDEVQDSSNRHYLEPHKNEFIKHIFWGVSPPKARIFKQYPARKDRNNLISVIRSITGDVGYVDGDESPYDGPFSKRTELFTLHDTWPQFQVYNPLTIAMNYVLMNFDIRSYTYNIMKSRPLIEDCLLGQRRCRKHTVGGIDDPVPIPAWLKELMPPGLLDWTLTLMESP